MILTALVTVLCFIILFFIYTTRTRSKDEPPLDSGFIPWLGHALDFSRDAAKFLARMKKKHGDIFTVRIAGHYITVLLDPKSYDAVLQDCDSLDYSNQKVVQRVFDLNWPNKNQVDGRLWMKQHFQGQNLVHLCTLMNKNIQALVRSPDTIHNTTNWEKDGLFDFCYRLLFKAGYLTLFGLEQNGTTVNEVYKEFRTFDGLLAKTARSTLSLVEKRTACSARQHLWNLLSLSYHSRPAVSSSWQQEYHQYLQEMGLDKETQRRAMLLQLWVTQCNAGPAAFWLLGWLLTHPKAMQSVRAEIERIMPNSAECLNNTHKTPVFDSVLNETLRLTAAIFINREVKKDMVLDMADGKAYRLRRGDRVCLFPYLSPQMDPSIHKEPEKFKYDRFLNTNGTEKSDFLKDTNKLKYYTLPWGAGANICVGQHFAINAIKQFVFVVLTSLDMELCDPNSSMPPLDPSRYGFGMLQPDGELPIRYRTKK
ncbi:prostacyclin synthase isoform X2 [Paramormyrops kingsleyae]|uniref:Prostacyclin synthase n=1 Tax=Paramormyrops kingsleyae TaxID=1676925 RepID=A0A3B3QVC3_9TELE|nr:prostacyclin synthase isoform X2 [Paramormyrops kingsleyae]